MKVFGRILPLLPLLPLLAACTLRTPQAAAPAVTLAVEAQAADVYNLVWLRASLRNDGPQPVWVLAQPDSVDLACQPAPGLGLAGRTPQGDSLAFCQRCAPTEAGRPRYVRLDPGQQRLSWLKVDFNYAFPASALAAMPEPCGKYVNRTPGEYRFEVVYRPAAESRRGSLTARRGNTVVVHRKK